MATTPVVYSTGSAHDWLLKLAIVNASRESLEGPWYGPWNIVLADLFRGFCLSKHFTATYPQLPLAKDIPDTVDDEDSEEPDQSDAGSEMSEARPNVKSWTSSPDRRSAAPSPESPKNNRRFRYQNTPPRDSSPQVTPFKLRDIAMREMRRSYQIPDFVQLLYQIKVNGNGTVNVPPIYNCGILLLVEIKKASETFDIVSVLNQTDKQAHHAFASYPRVKSFGCIIAFGDCWAYREYNRMDMRESPTLSEDLDSVYMDSDAGSRLHAQSTIVPSVEQAYRQGFARLQTQDSYDAFRVVKNRLGAIAEQMFRTSR